MPDKYLIVTFITAFLLLACVVIYRVFMPGTNSVESVPTTYEAESSANTFGGSATVNICHVCSGNYIVQYVGTGNNQTGVLQFNNIMARTSGSYTIAIYYVNSDIHLRTGLLSVNGADPININFPVTGTVTSPVVERVEVTVNLKEGSNTLMFSNPLARTVDFDKIVVTSVH